MPTAARTDEAAIREQAYYFWEQDGRPHGRDGEYWDRAVVALTPKPVAKKAAAAKPVAKAAVKPKAAAKPTPKLKAAASKTKAAPAKAETAKKPKKK